MASPSEASESNINSGLRLNLGCGDKMSPQHLNVDLYGEPDLRVDLEEFPWPWKDNSVEEIVLHHVLEHLGQSTSIFLNIMKEIYRVSMPGASVLITVPHPRHEHYISDPTHVRPITPNGLALFSQKKNLQWLREGSANTRLGMQLGVDFDIVRSSLILDEPWMGQFQRGEIDSEGIYEAEKRYNNVVKTIDMELKVVKPASGSE